MISETGAAFCGIIEEAWMMNLYEQELQNAFKPIKKNPIVLDFSGCEYLGQIHIELKQKFGLPEYYGQNWDALWDCLRYLFIAEGDYTVKITGLSTLPQELQYDCAKMLEVFDDVHAAAPNVSFELIS